jgi:NAD(P)-dependent dehydrogenase (short-subunit alcohol dehydrogenase family)
MQKSALVTGGTGGLGVAVTGRLLEDGWRVVVPWVAEQELERIEAHERLELVQADLTDPEAVEKAVALSAGRSDAPLSGVANLVGGFDAPGRVGDVPLERFEEQFHLNLRPTYLVTQAALAHLIAAGGGSIVCVGSRAGLDPFAGAAGYAGSKAAVIAFVKSLSVEYRDDGVRANAVLPSVIDTPANRSAMPNSDHDRWVKPEEIAAVIAFLLSSRSAATSGAAIPVYGRA